MSEDLWGLKHSLLPARELGSMGSHADAGGMSAALVTGAAENVQSGSKVCQRLVALSRWHTLLPAMAGWGGKGVLRGAPPKSSEGGPGKRSAQKTHALCVFGGNWRPWAPFSQTVSIGVKYCKGKRGKEKGVSISV